MPSTMRSLAQFAWRAIEGSASVDEVEARGLRVARNIMGGER